MARHLTCPSQKDAMYLSFGMDMQNVERIYPQIEHLEKCWKLNAHELSNTADLPLGAHFDIHIGPFKMTVPKISMDNFNLRLN